MLGLSTGVERELEKRAIPKLVSNAFTNAVNKAVGAFLFEIRRFACNVNL